MAQEMLSVRAPEVLVTARDAPRRWLYPAIGVATSPLLTVGLALLDASGAADVAPILYAYVIIAGCVILAGAGFAAGRTADRLRHQSLRDGLTQLWNRAALDQRIIEEIERVHRTGQPLALLLLDLDEFKGINDRFGHAAGDAVLMQVAECLRRHSRVIDVPARYGGDEFALLAPSTHAAQAMGLAERIRDAVAALPARDGRRVSVSIGVAAVQAGQAATPAELLAAADAQLYAVKAGSKAPAQPPQRGRAARRLKRQHRDSRA